MLNGLNNIVNFLNGYIWGVGMLVLIVGSGLYFTIRLHGFQFVHFKDMWSRIIDKQDSDSGISAFGSFCTTMAMRVGTGNVAGVAVAIYMGGPGALFWMRLAALVGMATKYSECLLSVKYRQVTEDGHIIGGPFYYIEKGMGSKFKWLAKIFAVFGVCVGLMGIGTFTQVNGIAGAVNNFFDADNSWTVSIFGRDYSWTVVIAAIAVTFFVALVIIGGIKRISSVAQVIVPFMAITYVILAVLIIGFNITKVPGAFATIVKSAFGVRAAAGGALGAMMVAMQNGIARGIFSNEAGLGSAPIAAAAAHTDEPAKQGLISMLGTFIDTIIICTMTGLAIVITGAWDMGLQGVAVTTKAFQIGLPFPGEVASFLLMVCLIFFAFTTILGWDYYSEKCLEYLTGGRMGIVKAYRWVYIACVFFGPFMTISAVWTIADIFNGLMAIPNLIALLALNGVVVMETKKYLDKINKKKMF